MPDEHAVPGLDEGPDLAPKHMPLGIVIARILIVSGMSFAAALGIFFLVGGIWTLGATALGITVVFLFLMFAVERLAS